MKKVLLIIILCLAGVLSVTFVRLNMIHNDKLNLQNEIKEAKENITNIETDNQKIKDDIEKTKEAKKDKWEELEIWKNYQEKIKRALS